MVTRLTVLLTMGAFTLMECEGGGTLEKPVADSAFCDRLIPPGMEHLQAGPIVFVYVTVISWFFHGIVVVMNVIGRVDQCKFLAMILQARMNNQLCGNFFIDKTIDGYAVDCPPGALNTWYSVNITEPRMRSHAFWIPPMNYEGKNFTMHTTIIRDHKTYYQYVDVIPPRPVPTTLAPAPPTTASNQTTNETSTKT